MNFPIFTSGSSIFLNLPRIAFLAVRASLMKRETKRSSLFLKFSYNVFLEIPASLLISSTVVFLNPNLSNLCFEYLECNLCIPLNFCLPGTPGTFIMSILVSILKVSYSLRGSNFLCNDLKISYSFLPSGMFLIIKCCYA